MTRLTAEWLFTPGLARVLSVLTGGGHQALVVGGCVRNALLGRPATDVDIATSAPPETVIALAEAARLRVIPTGLAHGTVTVRAGGEGFEVTTFRRDVATDGRHAQVEWSGDVAQDAARRDFTMNALYADAEGQVIDPLGGLPDLLAGRLRFIGDPHQRIAEDYLRILRFFRFHAWYADPQGGLDPEGLAACAEMAEGIDRLSRERVGAEMLKLMAAPDPAPAVGAMAISGVLARILPGAGAEVLARLVHVEVGAPPDPILRLAALGGTSDLRLSRAEARRVETLRAAALSDQGAAEIGYRLGVTEGHAALRLRAATLARMPTEAELSDLHASSALPITTADLPPELTGPAIGQALRAAESLWIASRFRIGRAELLRKIATNPRESG